MASNVPISIKSKRPEDSSFAPTVARPLFILRVLRNMREFTR